MTRSLAIVPLAALIALAGAPQADAAYPGINGKIAFVNGGEIWTIDPDGGSQKRLTFTTNLSPSATNSDPAWSPDGRRIAFTSVRDGNPNVYVMNADGTAPLQLTADPAADDSPTWSPDGRRIAFHSNRALGSGPYLSGDKIWIMGADGSDPTRASPSAARDLYPAWSPDGRGIVFVHQSNSGYVDISRADLEREGSISSLVDSAWYDIFPAWAPDGSELAFASRRDGNLDIYVAEPVLDGAQGRLTTALGADSEPAWSPDGRQIVFSSNRDGGETELYMMSLDGAGQTRIAERPGHDNSPDWQPLSAADVTLPDDGSGPPRPEPPALTALRVVPNRFSLRRLRKGISFRYLLSEPAGVKFSIYRVSRARRGVRYARVGGLTQRGARGSNRKRFYGRLRGRRLRVGRFQLRAVATDAVGFTSSTKRVRFRVVR